MLYGIVYSIPINTVLELVENKTKGEEKMKAKTKVIISVIALLLSAVLLFVTVAVNNTGRTTVIRNISLSENNV